MANEMSILRVEPQTLINTSEEFQSSGSRIQTQTEEMMNLVSGLTSIWESDASSIYISKFQGLSDDITRIIAMVNEHVADLQEMAANFISAESEAQAEAEALSGDVII